MCLSHLDPQVQAPHVEILQAQADRGVPLHEAKRRIKLGIPRKIGTESPGSGWGEAEFERAGGRSAAYLDVLGLEPVDELAEEIPELAEGEEQPVAEQRGQRRRVRQPHHLAPSLITTGSPPCSGSRDASLASPRKLSDFLGRRARPAEFESLADPECWVFSDSKMVSWRSPGLAGCGCGEAGANEA